MVENNKWSFFTILLVIFLSLSVFLLTFGKGTNNDPTVVYTVYLDGKAIGTIASEDSFNEFVNTKEDELKKKYNVDTVYTPRGVEIKKNLTYNNFINSDEQVYNKIISSKNFTVRGYQIMIVNPDDENDCEIIYVLSKDIFDKAVENTIKAFVDKDQYDKFVSGTQEEVKDSGSMIENIDLQETVTYKETLISTDEKIFTDVDELSKYLLYGTLDKQETYIVKGDDTIESIANSHKLNVQEFLIANPEFTSENNLLYESQEVVVGLIEPIISVVVDVHSVGEEEREYDTEIQYDSSQYVGYQEVVKEGENGLYKVTRKSQYINGQLVSATIANSTEIRPSVNRIIVKGDKYAPSVADLSYWGWPTDKPYTITSYFQYRWGTFHKAIDIYVGYGSPIYAANNGVVYKTGSGCYPGNIGCNGRQGNYVIINHNAGGYYTVYMHMKEFYVTEGQTVARGQKIGAMGNTGEVYPVPSSSNPYGGTHLHFEVRVGGAYGTSINPLSLY
ncbi:MAG: peptidoglycan DD-metalloendopeptidase family protein [Bacilli bacterium]